MKGYRSRLPDKEPSERGNSTTILKLAQEISQTISAATVICPFPAKKQMMAQVGMFQVQEK
jgi:hypothetical protein